MLLGPSAFPIRCNVLIDTPVMLYGRCPDNIESPALAPRQFEANQSLPTFDNVRINLAP